MFSFRDTLNTPLCYLLLASMLGMAIDSDALGEDTSASSRPLTYERDVRPILRTHCFQCHGEEEEPEGGLDLRLHRLIAKGGESGPAFVVGKPSESPLVERVRSGEMPPEDVKKRLSSAEIDLLARWVATGAKLARPEPESIDPAHYITDEERNFWAFRPIGHPQPPTATATNRTRTPIDQFLLAKLEEKSLSFSPDASKETLLRRAYFDLLGLPPSPEAIEQFLADEAPDAYGRLIDRLLSMPAYGERWGRHWLDVAGYADSEGYAINDVERPDAYKYRDYVIRSFNADKPYDQFIQEQLAGDEMVSLPYQELDADGIEKLVATGFLRMAEDGTDTVTIEKEIARNKVIADTIEIVSTSLLGLTVGCAQCHDHRYDPVSQTDYYRFRAIFAPAYDWKAWRTPKQRRVSLYTAAQRKQAEQIELEAKRIEADRKVKEEEYIKAVFERELAKLPSELHEPIRLARKTAAAKREADQKKLLKEHPTVNVTAKSLYLYDKKAAADLKKYVARAKDIRDTKPKQEFVRALFEPSDKAPPKSFRFARGDFQQPKEEVLPGELTALAFHRELKLPTNNSELPTTGRRLSYARWLTSGEHPLTARVLVNRVWLHHFGQGIVATAGDFGALGLRPTHPELLDWLASDFMDNGWSLKRLHKLIMTSTAYRQTSRREPAKDAIDAGNLLYWRMPVRRLEAEVIRDSILAISGKLNRKQFGPAVPVMADRVGQFVIGKENLNAGRPGAVIAMRGEEFRRSIYIQVRRSRPLAVLDTFDAPAMSPNCTERASSTVASQSLMLMNGTFTLTHAENLARRLQRLSGGDTQRQISLAWQLVYADAPTAEEMEESKKLLADLAVHFKANPPAAGKQSKKGAAQPLSPELEALTGFCQSLLSSNRFLYVD